MTKYLITYDIRHNKLRKKISDLLIRYGFERVQYSVFCGMSKLSDLKRLKHFIKGMNLDEKDSIIILPFSKINEEIQSKRISSLDFNNEVIII